MRIFRFLIGLALFVAFLWFGSSVPLGKKTFFEHVSAIAGSKETHELVEGTKAAAKPLVDKIENKTGRKQEPSKQEPSKQEPSKQGASTKEADPAATESHAQKKHAQARKPQRSEAP